MRSKRVLRYYCDYCKKAGLRKDVIAKHEAHCCRNPDRQCRMCEMVDQRQPSTVDLIAAAAVSLDQLREVAGSCPACVLTGILQWRKHEWPDGPPRYGGNERDGFAPDHECDRYYNLHEGFDFKAESDGFVAANSKWNERYENAAF